MIINCWVSANPSGMLRACLKSHFGQSYLHGNRVFSSKLGFFRNPERPTLFKRILSLYSANRVRSMIGTWFSSPTVWENQRLPPNAVRSGLPNPQHLGTISCFLKQVLSIFHRLNPTYGFSLQRSDISIEGRYLQSPRSRGAQCV